MGWAMGKNTGTEVVAQSDGESEKNESDEKNANRLDNGTAFATSSTRVWTMGDITVTEVVGQSQSGSRVKNDEKKEKNEKRIFGQKS